MTGNRERKRRGIPIWKISVCALCVALVMLMTPSAPANEPSAEPPTLPARASPPQASPARPLTRTAPVPGAQAAPEEAKRPAKAQPPGEPEGGQAPAPEAVDDAWFDDAVFLGDSRMEGFKLYAGLSNAQYLTAVGATVDTVFHKATERLDAGAKVPILDALAEKSFAKAYLMFGLNELGWVYPELFAEHYGAVVDRIRQLQPDADIYIESILPVTAEKDAEGGYINNGRIEQYNELLRRLAEDRGVHYLDVASAVADLDGFLPAEASFDGVHLKPEGCKTWLAYLRTHTAGAEAAEERENG